MSSNALPPHLALAAAWADSLISTAQSEQLSDIHAQAQQTQIATDRLSTAASRLESLYTETSKAFSIEHAHLDHSITASCRQLDTLGKLADALEASLGELERQVSSAETATGMSLGGRLSELSRLFSPNTGIPYLRQWAPKHQAVPEIPQTKDYFSK
ncbi:hypothetical protein EC988_003091 [Linderina pennispora]|nr:hypothetical protein EC988_003091 [Linderina pennispora]